MNDLRTLGRAMRDAQREHRRRSGSDAGWRAKMYAAEAAFDKALEAEGAVPQGDSAGLIARLRDKWQHSEEDCYAAADALEAAEARAVEAEQWMERAAQMDNEKTVQVVDANLRAEAAERQLAAAMEALEKINVGEGWAALIARAALTGEKP